MPESPDARTSPVRTASSYCATTSARVRGACAHACACTASEAMAVTSRLASGRRLAFMAVPRVNGRGRLRWRAGVAGRVATSARPCGGGRNSRCAITMSPSVSLGVAGISRTLSGRNLFGTLGSGSSIRKATASIAGLPISVLREPATGVAHPRKWHLSSSLSMLCAHDPMCTRVPGSPAVASPPITLTDTCRR